MRFNPKLKQDMAKYYDYFIVVEGKKDILALNSLGFENVHAIHQNSVSLRERVEELSKMVGKKQKICILTDLDKKGKQLYLLLKSLFQEFGVRLDSSLRGLLIKAQISHVEGLSKFMKKIEDIS